MSNRAFVLGIFTILTIVFMVLILCIMVWYANTGTRWISVSEETIYTLPVATECVSDRFWDRDMPCMSSLTVVPLQRRAPGTSSSKLEVQVFYGESNKGK